MDLNRIKTFLSELARNNNVDWMHAHRSEYLLAKGDFEIFVGELIAAISLFDSSVKVLLPKDCVFRINRDIRFSADKRPYKDAFSAYIVCGGKKSFRAGYYIQIHPFGETLIATGVYSADKQMLAMIRREILTDGDRLQSILSDPSFVAAFPDGMVGDRLIRLPLGFDRDVKFGEYIKMKSFYTMYLFSDSVLSDALSFFNDVVCRFKVAEPFNRFFNDALTDYVQPKPERR